MGQLSIFKNFFFFFEEIMPFWNGASLWSQLPGSTESIL